LKGKDTKTSEKGLEPIYDKFGNLANPKPLHIPIISLNINRLLIPKKATEKAV